MARRITHDTVAVIQGEDFKYVKARLLFDSEGNAAVFVDKSGPDRVFHVEDKSRMVGQRVTLQTDIGQVKYRRTGSGCSWPMARCRVATKQLAAKWPESSQEVAS